MKQLILLTLIAGCSAISQPKPPSEPPKVICTFKADPAQRTIRGPGLENLSCADYWTAVEQAAENGNINLLFCYALDSCNKELGAR